MIPYWNAISNVYKHITYCGSIGASILIYYNTFFMQEYDVDFHKKIISIAFFKSFMLYDCTPVEYVHHGIQFILSCTFYTALNKTYEDTAILHKAFKLTYYILFTPVFNNIKFYVPQNYTTIRLSLDALTAFFFFYYRSQFSYFWLSQEGNKVLVLIFGNYSIIFNVFAYMLTAMNVFWGYKILSIIRNKIRKLETQKYKKIS